MQCTRPTGRQGSRLYLYREQVPNKLGVLCSKCCVLVLSLMAWQALGPQHDAAHPCPFHAPPAVDIGWESVEQLAQRILDPKASNRA